MPTLFTVGHSTRQLPELVDLLRESNVKLLVDVRTIPKSGTNPQFNKDKLAEQLPEQYDMQYSWLGKELGGLRKRDKSSETNAGWDNASFRGYADYMQTPEFSRGVQQLMQMAEEQGPAAIMCAEAVHWRCHRSLISDALLVRGWQVQHITAAAKPPIPHKLTKFAHVQGEAITYPAYEHEPAGRGRKGRKQQQATAEAKQQEGRRKSSTTAGKKRTARSATAAAAPTTTTPTKQQRSAESVGGTDDAAKGSKQLEITQFISGRTRSQLQQQQQWRT